MTLLFLAYNSNRGNSDALWFPYWSCYIKAYRIFYSSLPFWNSTHMCVGLDSFYSLQWTLIGLFQSKCVCHSTLEYLHVICPPPPAPAKDHHFQSDVHGIFFKIPIMFTGNYIFIQPYSSWFDDLEALLRMMTVASVLTLSSTFYYTHSLLVLSLLSISPSIHPDLAHTTKPSFSTTSAKKSFNYSPSWFL